MINHLERLIKTATLDKISYLVKTFSKKELQELYRKIKQSDEDLTTKTQQDLRSDIVEHFRNLKG